VSCGALDTTVMADATRLRQVLLNLLSNAVKYNRHGGKVHIEAVPRGAEVLLRVSDTGRGMSDQQLRHLFRALQPPGPGRRRHRRHGHRPGHREDPGRTHGGLGAGAKHARPGQRLRTAAAGR
jgi:signal transduction histidine kinase